MDAAHTRVPGAMSRSSQPIVDAFEQPDCSAQAVVALISSPIALLVALAGMTNKVIAQREQYAAQLRSGLSSNDAPL